MDDLRPRISHDEIKARLQRLVEAPRAASAVWQKSGL
jgi:hypothetical protein